MFARSSMKKKITATAVLTRQRTDDQDNKSYGTRFSYSQYIKLLVFVLLFVYSSSILNSVNKKFKVFVIIMVKNNTVTIFTFLSCTK